MTATSENSLEEFLRRNGIWHRFIIKPETIHTADAAKVAGIELSKLAKNLVSVTDSDEFVMLIVPGDKKVDFEAAAKALNVRHIRLVPFDKAESVSGYLPGGTPSIGHKNKMKCIIDRSLVSHDTIFCGGGTRNRLLELKTSDIIRINRAIIADISRTP